MSDVTIVPSTDDQVAAVEAATDIVNQARQGQQDAPKKETPKQFCLRQIRMAQDALEAMVYTDREVEAMKAELQRTLDEVNTVGDDDRATQRALYPTGGYLKDDFVPKVIRLTRNAARNLERAQALYAHPGFPGLRSFQQGAIVTILAQLGGETVEPLAVPWLQADFVRRCHGNRLSLFEMHKQMLELEKAVGLELRQQQGTGNGPSAAQRARQAEKSERDRNLRNSMRGSGNGGGKRKN